MDLKFIFVTVLIFSCVDVSFSRRLDNKLLDTVKYAVEQYSRVLKDDPVNRGRFPHTGQPGSSVWDDDTDVWGWTAGFFPGVLWEIYRQNNHNETWSTAATDATTALRRRENDTGTHDIGFVIMSSFGIGLNSGSGRTM